jgi:hypothetical protein
MTASCSLIRGISLFWTMLMPDRYTVGYFYLCDKFRGYNKDKEGAAACRGKWKGKKF